MSGSINALMPTEPIPGTARDNPLLQGTPTMSEATSQAVKGVLDWVQQQRAQSEQQGLWGPGGITPAGARSAGMQTAMAPVMGTAGPKGEVPGFTAFHGSPHDFDQFDASKIGTGEGAQAYGHGLYLADAEGVAKSYRDNLTQPTLPTPTSISGKPTYDLWNKYADPSGALTIDSTIWHGPRDFVRNLQQGRTTLEGAPPDLAAALQSHVNQGRMYEVRVNADPQHFLDWDNPVGAHPPEMRDKLLDMGYGDPDKGSEVYFHMARGPNGDEGASQRLAAAGIPGIRYLDAGSRSAGEGTKNSVIFDPKILTIMRKYAIPASMLSGVGHGLVTDGDGAP